MSKLNVRVVLSVLISLVVIFAVYTTVQSATLNPVSQKIGSHSVSGMLTNFNHDRLSVAEQELYQSQSESFYDSGKGSGRGCDSEKSTAPID